MRISTFFYTIRQGFKNIFRNKSFSLASIATITACLFMLGVVYAVVLNMQFMVKSAEEGVSVTVFFKEGTDEATFNAIGDEIAKRIEVSKVVPVTPEEAWESFKTDYLGEYADGFTENPLENSGHFEIYLKDVSYQSALVTYLQSIPQVRRVNQSEIVANTLAGFNSLMGYVSVGMIAILLGVSIFLIVNTVTIGISVRKEEISIMKYIGATDFFVRSPFVVEGMLIGLIGAAIPLVLIYFLYVNTVEYITQRFSVLSTLLKFLPVETVMSTLIPVSLGIGVGIGFIGSFITVRKHLHV
ncbi:MAG: permease-like cell division protein FtsX [Lachnospiraceae bacterium]|jgi:cell division transport system permease protein|nr:ABC transporter permease [Lachnospiraceae bacterium]MBQ3794264.1 permease-like cell division protein FtsX [Lachnospiraceae bacterium]MBQ5375269.1 permease-like cell division protein FtsX [Lachnospiraceae bacterium]MCR5320103.1 permease-like cell division protein FtsX [Lachnospiraceae bacterium]